MSNHRTPEAIEVQTKSCQDRVAKHSNVELLLRFPTSYWKYTLPNSGSGREGSEDAEFRHRRALPESFFGPETAVISFVPWNNGSRKAWEEPNRRFPFYSNSGYHPWLLYSRVRLKHSPCIISQKHYDHSNYSRLHVAGPVSPWLISAEVTGTCFRNEVNDSAQDHTPAVRHSGNTWSKLRDEHALLTASQWSGFVDGPNWLNWEHDRTWSHRRISWDHRHLLPWGVSANHTNGPTACLVLLFPTPLPQDSPPLSASGRTCANAR